MNKYFVVLQKSDNVYHVIDCYLSQDVILDYYKGPFPQSVSYVMGPMNLIVDIAKCELINNQLVISQDDVALERYVNLVKNQIRGIRDKILSLTDWTIGLDSPFSPIDKSSMVSYRQSWRDLPSLIDASNYFSIPYPDLPEISDDNLSHKIQNLIQF